MNVTELNDTEFDELVGRVKQAAEHQLALSSHDLQLLLQALLMLSELQDRLAAHDISVKKLRKLAGIVSNSEQLKDLVPQPVKPAQKKRRRQSTPTPRSDTVVHERCHHAIEGLEKGQTCPECQKGRLYKYDPAVRLRIRGQTPLVSTQHILERLRCNTCGAYFTAPLPTEVQQDGADDQRYGYSARALMGINKCYAGSPYNRQQSVQQLLGMPVAASTIFDQCEHLANDVRPVVKCLIAQAAEATHYQLDDTTNRILNQAPVMKPDRHTGKLKQRSGIYTSGVIATLADGHRCVLFQTNIGHAGEWIDEITASRRPDSPPPVLMSDALSSNLPTQLITYIKSLCNAHARREFVDVIDHFPDKIPWVLERYALIWKHDDHCKEHHYCDQQRLDYHRQHSLAVMEQLRDWGQDQLETHKVETNSSLGKAIAYFLRHFEGLTAFCQWPGVTLDNNEMEATLKLIIRGRKNSLFFKSLAGAAVADALTSLIATCDKAEVNTFEYLVALQRHAQVVKRQPQLWLPWNYHQTLEALETEKACSQSA